MTGFDLATIAPRLALAHRQRADEIIAERVARHHAREQLESAERLVAHRELQLLRAGATGDRSYVRRRDNKLTRARAHLAAARAVAEQLGAVPPPRRPTRRSR